MFLETEYDTINVSFPKDADAHGISRETHPSRVVTIEL